MLPFPSGCVDFDRGWLLTYANSQCSGSLTGPGKPVDTPRGLQFVEGHTPQSVMDGWGSYEANLN